MPKTPDRAPGVSDEEGTIYEATQLATSVGEVRYDGSRFSMYDSVGEFDPRAGGAGTDDRRLKVSTDDTTPGFLEEKVVAGPAVSLATLNPAGDEKLEVTVGYRRSFLLMGA